MKHTKVIFAIISIAMVIWLSAAPCFAVYQQDEVNLSYDDTDYASLYRSQSQYETYVYPVGVPFYSELDEIVLTRSQWAFMPTPLLYSVRAVGSQDTIDPETGLKDQEAMNFIPFYGYEYFRQGVVGGDIENFTTTTPMWEAYSYETDSEGYTIRHRIPSSQADGVRMNGTFARTFGIGYGGGRITITYNLRVYRTTELTLNNGPLNGAFVMTGSTTLNSSGDRWNIMELFSDAYVAFGEITIVSQSTASSVASWHVQDLYKRVYDNYGALERSFVEDLLLRAQGYGTGTYTITDNGTYRVDNSYRNVVVNVPKYTGQPNLLGFVTTSLEGIFGLEFMDGWTLGSVFGVVVVVVLMIWILKVVAGG